MKGRDAVIGTNFYIRKKKPTIHEVVHICKRSFGWRTTWQATSIGYGENDWPKWCDENPAGEPTIPNEINSVEDIRNYLRTGEWELVDEYGKVYEDWESQLRNLEEFDGGKSAWEANHPDMPLGWDKPHEHDVETGEGFRDFKGNIFVRTGFC